MNNVDTSTSNRTLFPNSRQAQQAKKLNKTVLARNNQARIKELDGLTKDDAKVSITNAVKDFARIKKAVDAAPEVDNSDKIARLKSQIQSGTYKVDYDALADKILQEEL